MFQLKVNRRNYIQNLSFQLINRINSYKILLFQLKVNRINYIQGQCRRGRKFFWRLLSWETVGKLVLFTTFSNPLFSSHLSLFFINHHYLGTAGCGGGVDWYRSLCEGGHRKMPTISRCSVLSRYWLVLARYRLVLAGYRLVLAGYRLVLAGYW